MIGSVEHSEIYQGEREKEIKMWIGWREKDIETRDFSQSVAASGLSPYRTEEDEISRYTRFSDYSVLKLQYIIYIYEYIYSTDVNWFDSAENPSGIRVGER